MDLSISEWLGFLIALAAILNVVLRGRGEKEPESLEGAGQEEVLHDFLTSLKNDMKEAKEIKKKKPSQRAVEDSFTYKADLDGEKLVTKIEKRQFHTDIEKDPFLTRKESISSPYLPQQKADDAYVIREVSEQSVISKILERVKSKEDFVLLQVIMGPPKGLQRAIDSHDYY